MLESHVWAAFRHLRMHDMNSRSDGSVNGAIGNSKTNVQCIAKIGEFQNLRFLKTCLSNEISQYSNVSITFYMKKNSKSDCRTAKTTVWTKASVKMQDGEQNFCSNDYR